MNKSLQLGIKLLIITAISGLALAYTNQVTAPKIEAANQAKLEESLKVAYPSAKSFEEVKGNFNESIIGAYKTDDGGYVFDVKQKGGYGGPIEFIFGVDKDKKITGFSPLQHQESAGFGSKMEEDWFKDGTKGVSVEGEIGYSEKGSENEIVGISGATYSTKTIVAGMNAAREALESIK